MKALRLKCPYCGADLHVNADNSRTYCFCEYCGQKLLLDDSVKRSVHTENINIVYREINEAGILEAKNNREKLKYEKNRYGIGHALVKIVTMLLASLFALIIFGTAFDRYENAKKRNQHKKYIEMGMVLVEPSYRYEGERYEVVVAELKACGFSNFELIDLDDADEDHKKGTIASISIGGSSSFYSDSYFSTDELVIISYH